MSNVNEHIQRLEAELAALKAEVLRGQTSMPKGFEMWVPRLRGTYYSPEPTEGVFCHNYNYPDNEVLRRGLAFESGADAAEVGKYLAVVGKLCNAAKQLNKGKVFDMANGRHEYYCLVADTLNGIQAVYFTVTTSHGPRFHSREAAEVALGLLSEDEKATFVRGIA